MRTWPSPGTLAAVRGNIRVVQVQGIGQLLAETTNPFLLGGDFNASPDSLAMGIVAQYDVDPWPDVGVGGGLTVPSRVPQRRIDYVLHSGPWRARQADVLPSSVSDHRAVRTKLDLFRPEGC